MMYLPEKNIIEKSYPSNYIQLQNNISKKIPEKWSIEV